jgi:hypothetical protein
VRPEAELADYGADGWVTLGALGRRFWEALSSQNVRAREMVVGQDQPGVAEPVGQLLGSGAAGGRLGQGMESLCA